MIPASKFGAAEEAQEALVLTDEEKKIEEEIFVCIFKQVSTMTGGKFCFNLSSIYISTQCFSSLKFFLQSQEMYSGAILIPFFRDLTQMFSLACYIQMFIMIKFLQGFLADKKSRGKLRQIFLDYLGLSRIVCKNLLFTMQNS